MRISGSSRQETTANMSQHITDFIQQLHDVSEQPKQSKEDYPIPLYKGHFVKFHQEEVEFSSNVLNICGVYNDFAYIANQKNMMFYFFGPIEQDLNIYYNIDEYNPFEMRRKQFTFEDDVVAVEFCKQKNYYIMIVALRFTVQFFTFDGDLENFMKLEKELNPNGEEIQMMKYLESFLIVGGDSGSLRRYSLNDVSHNFGFLKSWKSLPGKLKKIFKRHSLKQITQIVVDEIRAVCYALVELKIVKEGVLLVDSTEIQVYDLGVRFDLFNLVATITQEQIFQQLQSMKDIMFEDFFFFHIAVIPSSDHREAQMSLTTNTKIQIQIHFQTLQMSKEEMISVCETDNMSLQDVELEMQKKLQYKCDIHRFTSIYTVRGCKQPYNHSGDDHLSIKVTIDEQSISTRIARSVDKKNELTAIYSEPNITIMRTQDQSRVKLYAIFEDPAHQGFEKSLEQLRSRTSLETAIDMSLFKIFAHQALEVIDDSNPPIPDQAYELNHYQIASFYLRQVFKISETLESQIHNGPRHFAVFSENGLQLIMQMRPVDLFFTALKATPHDFLMRKETHLPLEQLIQTYGAEESCVNLLMIILQADNDFYINKELEIQFQEDICSVIRHYEPSIFVDKYLDSNDNIPQWASGKIYSQKGSRLTEKARLVYHNTVSRNLNHQVQRTQSVKVYSTTQVLKRSYAPLYDKVFFDKKSFNLLSNDPLSKFDITQLTSVYTLLQSLTKLFQEDQEFYYKPQEQQNTNAQNNGFVNGFNKNIFEQFTRKSNKEHCSLFIEGTVNFNCFYEHKLMTVIYQQTKIIAQFLFFLNLTLKKENLLREILIGQDDMFKYKINDLINGNLQPVKNLMLALLKKDPTIELDLLVPDFYDHADITMTQVQMNLDSLINDLLVMRVINTPDNILSKFYNRFKKIIVPIDLKQRKTLIYYKNLQPDVQEKINFIIMTLSSVIPSVSTEFLDTLFPYIIVFAIYPPFFELLAQKCIWGLKYEDQEKQNTVYHFVGKIFRYTISLMHNQPFQYEVVSDIVKIISKCQIELVHHLIVQELHNHGFIDLIVQLKSPYALQLDIDELERLILENKQTQEQLAQRKNDSILIQTLIENSIKLGKINLEDRADLDFEQLIKKFPLTKRQELINEAIYMIKKNGLNHQGADLTEQEMESQSLKCVIDLQVIMFDYCMQQTYRNEQLAIKRSMLIKIQPIEQIDRFFAQNQLYDARIMSIDVLESVKRDALLSSDIDIQQIYADLFQKYGESPAQGLVNRIRIILEKCINKDKFVIRQLETIIQLYELVNCSFGIVSTSFFETFSKVMPVEEQNSSQTIDQSSSTGYHRMLDEYLKVFAERRQIHMFWRRLHNFDCKVEIEQYSIHLIETISQIILKHSQYFTKGDQSNIEEFLDQARINIQNVIDNLDPKIARQIQQNLSKIAIKIQ